LAQADLFHTSSKFLEELENLALTLVSRVTRNSTFRANGKYGRSFKPTEKIKVEAGAQLASENQNELIFPAVYCPDKDSFIRLPNEWVTYFTNETYIKFVGIQIKPEYLNSIFPRNLNRYTMKYIYAYSSNKTVKSNK
jgi:hypothetical protein